jgi:hypothetical protein
MHQYFDFCQLLYNLTPCPSPKERGVYAFANFKIASNVLIDCRLPYNLTPCPSPKER